MQATGQYSWVIKGNKLSTMMKKAESENVFVSDTFQMACMDWCIEICCVDGSFDVLLKLLSSPQKGNKIIVFRRIYCKEFDTSDSSINSYKKESSFGWFNHTLSFHEIKNSHVKQLTITVNIQILKIINESFRRNKIIYENNAHFNTSLHNKPFKYNIN
eukprot:541581_1